LSKNTLSPSKLLLIVLGAVWSGPLTISAQPVAAAKAVEALAPTPNYVGKLSHQIAWRKFPVSVYFIRDDHYSQSREQFAKHGFNRWVIVTDGIIDFVVTDDPDDADLTVRFDPKTDNGYTLTRFRDGRISRADITIGVRQGAQYDVEAVAAHEFGHAMGIDGHSDNKRDLMYPVHWSGTPSRITERDLNTLAARYPFLSKALAARREARERDEDRDGGAAR
jgi:hypothetical protein